MKVLLIVGSARLGREPINLRGVRLARVRYAPIATKFRSVGKGRDGRVEDGRGNLGHSATPRFPSPLIGRVEDWRAGLGRSLYSPLSRPFVCECHTISTVPRFQPPPRRTQRADFPHCALLFASPQDLWDLSCWGDFRQRSANPVAVEQPQGFVQPLPTPSRPTEALSFPSAQHVAPNLLFHPVFDEAEALAGMPHRKVVHPTA